MNSLTPFYHDEGLLEAEERLKLAIARRQRMRRRAQPQVLNSSSNQNRNPLWLSTPTGIPARLFHRGVHVYDTKRSLSLEPSFKITKLCVRAAISSKRQGQLRQAETWLRLARTHASAEKPMDDSRVFADLDLALSVLFLCGVRNNNRYAEAEQLCVKATCRYQDLRIDEDDSNVKLAHELMATFRDDSRRASLTNGSE